MKKRVSVVIPVRNEVATIAEIVTLVRSQATPAMELEVLVVDDGSSDGTGPAAEAAGARILRLETGPSGGNPAAARNHAARKARGDHLVFLDADCIPTFGWLAKLLQAHERGETIVGGALDLPPGLPFTARCDYYCGWYHVHSRRPAGYVPNHPPGNLSVDRELFLSTRGFEERHPIAFAHEELGWQAELAQRGHRIRFESSAIVLHRNRPGFGNLLRRNYRWAYSAVESKASTGAARLAWMYKYPRTLVFMAPPMALAQTAYILGCWLRAGSYEPLLFLPAVLSARLAYAAGMASGTLRWMRTRHAAPQHVRPRWE
jgi:glycosyltransferase involved in cell wall biosynthesis